MSGRCVPPLKGSFRIQRSLGDTTWPGSVASEATASTAAGMDPRCTGMCSACITSSAFASKRAVEQSRRSLMLGEWAARTSTAPISSQIALSPPLRTWSPIGSKAGEVIGSRRRSPRSCRGRRRSPASPPGREQRRLRQLEHARALGLESDRRFAHDHVDVSPVAPEPCPAATEPAGISDRPHREPRHRLPATSPRAGRRPARPRRPPLGSP